MLDKSRLEEVSRMTFDEFVTEQERNNLDDVPARTKMLILGGMAGWEETLTSWYESYKREVSGVQE